MGEMMAQTGKRKTFAHIFASLLGAAVFFLVYMGVLYTDSANADHFVDMMKYWGTFQLVISGGFYSFNGLEHYSKALSSKAQGANNA